MVLNEKEKNIVWILGVGVGVLVLYLGWNWWMDQRKALDVAHNKLLTAVNTDTNTLDRAKKAEGEFQAMKVQILDPVRLDQSATDRLVQQMFSAGGLTFTNWGGTTARVVASNKEFMEAKYTGSATTTTARLARFLQYIETAKLPARIDEMTITTPKAGIDSLRVEFKVSALLYLPPKPTGPATRSGASSSSRAATTSRPSTGPGATRPVTSTTAPAANASMSDAELERKTQELIKRREAEAARLATMPVAPPPVKRTPEEIERDMEAKRAAEDMATATQTSTKPEAPKPAPTPGGTP